MKLLSCYIAGFGKFVDKSFDFTLPITEIYGENGWGKTTLACFIKCMFFGLDGGRIKSVQGNERIKYKPWNSERFGGRITIEYKGKRYRIERTFGKTAIADEIKVYDENNMPCTIFNLQKLGEELFGMDGESFRRSVYIPQGEISVGELPDTMKNRLLTLLTDIHSDGEGALERLEKAEKSLRAKRKPAKGKLDCLDERLDSIRRQKIEKQGFLQKAEEGKNALVSCGKELEHIQASLQVLDKELENTTVQGEAFKKQELARLEAELRGLDEEWGKEKRFFAGIAPSAINVTALEDCAAQFYKEQKAAIEFEEKRIKFQTLALEKERMQAKEKGKGKRKTDKFFVIFSCISMGLLALGIWLFTRAAIGKPMLFVGFAGVLISMLLFYKKSKARYKDKVAKKQIEGLEQEFSGYGSLKKEEEKLLSALVKQRKEVEKLQGELEGFFHKFPSLEGRDFAIALSTIKEKVATGSKTEQRIALITEQIKELKEQLKNTKQDEREVLKAKKSALEKEKEERIVYKTQLVERIERMESQGDSEGLSLEEEYLKEEKERLEKRLTAIKLAKEILLRSNENMAARYLQPVAKKCEEYLQTIGAGMRTLQYSANGEPWIDDGGRMREVDYYSAGEKELIGFCTRIALVEALFEKETPILILDDSFINLDDDRTAGVKALVQKLSARYQIVYFTCKKDRKITD